VLTSLPPAERESLLRQCPKRTYEPGVFICVEGEVGDEFHLIEAGRVALRIASPAGDITTLSILGPGQAFGEMALVGNRPRTATGVSLERVTTRVMSRQLFTTLRQRHPGVNELLVDILASRVDRLSRQVAEASYLPVDARLARRLLMLTEVYRDGSAAVVLPLTQQDLAGLAGATRPTINVELNRLAAKHLVRLSRGHVTILDEAGLGRLAAGTA
jgi:CRP/FNR family cyclic AMP-dependent transcriptional regulator